MEKWIDGRELACIYCKHTWTVLSNKIMTKEQIAIWLIDIIQEHELIHMKGEL